MQITQLVYKENKMKKFIILALMVLVGISLLSLSFADEARTIPMKFGCAKGANTIIVAHGGTLYKVTGFASSANATYGLFNTATINGAESTNVVAEGGEATQYDSIPTIDFGDEGIEFNTGLTAITTTTYVAVMYR